MAILLSDIRISMEQPPEQALVKAQALLGGYRRQICESHLHKVSIDARRRGHIQLVCSVAVELEDSHAEKAAVEELGRRGISARLRQRQELVFTPGSVPLSGRPVIIGFGPAGMFAGLILAQNGYRPLILERGDQVENRVRAVEGFWKTGELDSATNVQFGEGGAGTFPTASRPPVSTIPGAVCAVELVRFGAPRFCTGPSPISVRISCGSGSEIAGKLSVWAGRSAFSHQPSCCCVTPGMRGENTPGSSLPGRYFGDRPQCQDTFSMLIEKGLPLEPKPFSVGVRIEHLQSRVDESLFGAYAGHPALGKGEYQLSQRRGEDAVYTFCMCPGGLVVPSSSEPGGTVTNGMSEFARDGKNANAALVVSVSPKDFGTHPM
ncbi:MAG: NAD(P)/FAD-dependent oxidoreductase, partial [Oscillospiraceae bacterium]